MNNTYQVPINPLTNYPNQAWDELQVNQVIKTLELDDSTRPIDPNKIRFVCLSDTHSKIEKIPSFVPPGDVILHTGDFTRCGELESIHNFDTFLGNLPHKRKIVIAGNHEISLDTELSQTRRSKVASIFGTQKTSPQNQKYNVSSSRELLHHCIYLQDSFIEVCGIKVYGTPWQPEFCGWAFNLPRGKVLAEKWDLIPDDIDILMTHSPPLGFGDLCTSQLRAGCVELLTTVQQRVKPKFHLFGHIHEGYGVTTDGQTVFINGSNCNISYKLVNKPVVFDYPIPEGHSKAELESLPVNNLGAGR